MSRPGLRRNGRARDLHVLTGSYVLDAVSDQEREEFERHLPQCPSCDAEVRGLRETAARLALAAAVVPPARMEPRVLAAAHRTRQLPPLPGPRRLTFPRIPRRLTFPRIPRRAVTLAAAASVAVAAGLGVTQLTTQHRLQSVRAGNAAIARVLTAPDARVRIARTRAGGSVTVVASAGLREAVVSATGMAAPPAGRVYQVWVMSDSGARSAGLLHGGTLLASAVAPGDRIGITVEPAGGSRRPTTTPVAVLAA
jgi:anti-sigma factor RsiW